MIQLGKTQFINRQKINSSDDTLYFTIYNLDSDYRRIDMDFIIYIDVNTFPGTNLICYQCLNGGRRKFPSLSCLCDRCDPGFYGPDCSINMRPLTMGQTTSTVLNGPGMVFFMIEDIDEVNILVKTSVGTG